MMTSLFWLATAGILAWGAYLTWQVIWSRVDTSTRAAAVFGFILMIPSVMVINMALLGNHRPMTWETIKHVTGGGDLRAKLLGHKMHFGKAIYLYLDQPGEPLALVLPWDTRTAEELGDAMKKRGQPWVILPYEFSWNEQRRPRFETVPPPKMPDKPLEERRVKPYERGAESQWQNMSGARITTTSY